MPKIQINTLNNYSQKQIQLAGPRYTPGITPTAPNLQIKRLIQAIDALELSDKYENTLQNFINRLCSSWEKAPIIVKNNFKKYKQTPESLFSLLKRIKNFNPCDSIKHINQAERSIHFTRKYLNDFHTVLLKKMSNKTGDEKTLQYQIEELSKFRDEVELLYKYTSAPAFNLVYTNRLFLCGKWGTGKTHFLCDVTKRRLQLNQPTLLILAQGIPDGKDPLERFCSVNNWIQNKKELLSNLNELGRKTDNRALLIIDGINEGDREGWHLSIESLFDEIIDYPFIGLVISCRSPFDELILQVSAKRKTIQIQHAGFVDIEFEAQNEFFNFYRIPTPHFPLLVPEFSRPLFLKLTCEAFSNLADVTKKKNQKIKLMYQCGLNLYRLMNF